MEQNYWPVYRFVCFLSRCLLLPDVRVANRRNMIINQMIVTLSLSHFASYFFPPQPRWEIHIYKHLSFFQNSMNVCVSRSLDEKQIWMLFSDIL